MSVLGVKRKRRDMEEETFYQDSSDDDELSESRTSGSSFNPSDSEENSDSSDEELDILNVTVSSNAKTEVEIPKKRKAGEIKDKLVENRNEQGISTGVCQDLKRAKSKSIRVCSTKSKSKHFDKKIIDLACQRLKEGVNYKAVAKEFGIKEHTISYWLYKFIPKEERFKKSRVIINEKMLECCNLFKQGASKSYLAKLYRVHKITIDAWLHKLAPEAFPLEPMISRNHEKILDVCRQLQRGDSTKEIAARMGVHTSTLQQWKIKYMLTKVQETTLAGAYEHNRFTRLEALHQLQQGVAAKIVAKNLNVDISLIHKWESEDVVRITSEPVSEYDESRYEKDFVLNACKRLQQGESRQKVAKEIGITMGVINRWANKYCLKIKQKPRDGPKFDKGIITAVCKLIEKGNVDRVIAEKFKINRRQITEWRNKYFTRGELEAIKYNDSSAIERLVKCEPKCDRNTILKACKLMREGNSMKKVVKDCKTYHHVVQRWYRDYLLKNKELVPKRKKKFDENLIAQVCDLLKQGVTRSKISKELGITWQFVDHLQRTYARSGGPNNLEHSSDVKLKSKPVVVLVKDRRIDALCQKLIIDPIDSRKDSTVKTRVFVPTRKIHIPTKMKLRFVKMIENGVSVAKLSKELNINELIIRSWILNQELLRNSSTNTKIV